MLRDKMDDITFEDHLQDDINTNKNKLATESIFSKQIVDHCLLTWTIQNFPLVPKNSQKYVTSPSFSLDSSSTTWFVDFYPYSMIEGKKGVKFCLNREQDHAGPNAVTVTYRIGFGKYHVWSEEIRKILFKPGDVDYSEFFFSEHLDSQNAFHENSLVIHCEMYITLCENEGIISQLKLTKEYIDLLQLTLNLTEFAQKSEGSDVVIRVKDLRISAHKAILAARSPVFARKLKDECSSLDLLEVDYDHISNILLYIYSGSFNLVAMNGKLAIGLYECAARYAVSGLKELLLPTQIGVCSTIRSEKIDFKWTIERFSGFDLKIGDYMTSHPFDAGYKNSSVWFVDIYPQGSSEIPNSVGIFVRTTDVCESLGINVSMSILDDNMKELYVKHTNRPLLNHHSTFGFPRFIDKEKLTPTAELLRNDKLIIKCKMEFIVPKHSYKKTGLLLRSSLANDTCYDLKRLSKDFEKLLCNGTLCDTTLIAENEMFFVHKVVLSARSSVFSNLILTNKEKDCVIGISNISCHVLEEMIFYAYTGKFIDVASISVVELYEAAAEYCMKSLVNSCSLYLSSSLDVKCVCDVIMLSHKYKDRRLMSKCLKYIEQNMDEILVSTEWTQMMKTRYNLSLKIMQWLSQNLNDRLKLSGRMYYTWNKVSIS